MTRSDPRAPIPPRVSGSGVIRWGRLPVTTDHIVDALASLGGKAHLNDIVKRVSEIAPAPLPVDVGASVRARIQERCAEAKSYKRGENLFYSVYGVDAREGWWGLRSDPLAPSNDDGFHDGADAFFDSEEGRARLRIHLRRERSQVLVSKFKESLSSLACCVCEFDFDQVYGERGRGYIEAHHVIPVAKLTEGSRTQLSDLVPVCANCHRMLHRNDLLSWQDLRAVLQLRSSMSKPDSAE